MVDTPGNKVGDFLKGQTAGLPNWAWLLIIGLGIGGAVVLPKILGGQGTTSTGQTDTGLGLALDPTNGLPYAVEGLVPGGANGGATPPPTTTTTTPPPTTTTAYMTRSPIQFGYGSGAPSVPVRDAPGGNVIGSVPYDQAIQIVSGPVSGPNNFGPNVPSGVGSTQWYQLQQGGFVSAHDIRQTNVGSTGPSLYYGPNWPYVELNRRRKLYG